MKRNLPHKLIAAAALTLLLGACGQSAAVKQPTATPHVVTTPIPQDLLSYASYVYPTLQSSMAEGDTLLSQMRHSYVGDLGNQCSQVGGDFANYRSTVGNTLVPASAVTVHNYADLGFKFALAAMDECGMAADASSSRQMATAVKDLQYGLWELSRAESVVSPWYTAKG